MILIRTILIAAFILPILSFHVHLNAQPPNSGNGTAKGQGAYADPARSSAKALLKQATELLENHYSIQGDITYHAQLLGRRINGKGSYAELRTKSIPYMRMELKIPVDDKMGVLVKVCDSRYLWTYRKMLGHESLEQVDMDRVQEAMEKKNGVSQTGSGSFQPSLSPIGVGGLATILHTLNQNFDFATPTPSKLDRMPIWRLEGTWNRDNLLRLLPKQKKAIEQGKSPDLAKLPTHIPDRVAVSLGTANHFPYRIEYFRSDNNGEEKASSAGQGRAVPIMTIYLHDVHLNQPIPESHFDYRPGELEPVDKTHGYIEKLK